MTTINYLVGSKIGAMTTVISASKDGIYDCKKLRLSNRDRVTFGEPTVSVFKDDEWYLRVGIEFLEIKFCPFCGELL